MNHIRLGFRPPQRSKFSRRSFGRAILTDDRPRAAGVVEWWDPTERAPQDPTEMP